MVSYIVAHAGIAKKLKVIVHSLGIYAGFNIASMLQHIYWRVARAPDYNSLSTH